MHETTVSRRDIFKLLAAASAAGAMLPKQLAAQAPRPLTRPFKNPLTDPDFLNPVAPWEKPLVDTELATLAVLCDLIIPGDADSPAPSKIGLPDFLNEWVGAPYDDNRADYEIIRGGLAWISTRSNSLHALPFIKLTEAQQTAILDSICHPANTAPELSYGSRFFQKLRLLTLGGYYSHSSTWKSLGYVGNIPIAGPYPGVPDEIIKLLGLGDVIDFR
ncbi:MAG: gluconate 2-dehydrogenase subunit 3 family protein [Armatimonadetes bacterium]|nr:gluconate 2-dehydrogenase subunit 3 family protein [Akkermansiaceae bacterium]